MTLGSHIEFAYHALAIDERRKFPVISTVKVWKEDYDTTPTGSAIATSVKDDDPRALTSLVKVANVNAALTANMLQSDGNPFSFASDGAPRQAQGPRSSRIGAITLFGRSAYTEPRRSRTKQRANVLHTSAAKPFKLASNIRNLVGWRQ